MFAASSDGIAAGFYVSLQMQGEQLRCPASLRHLMPDKVSQILEKQSVAEDRALICHDLDATRRDIAY